jgi:hypothetical protein
MDNCAHGVETIISGFFSFVPLICFIFGICVALQVVGCNLLFMYVVVD